MKLKNISEKQTGHNSWLPTELGRAGITIGPEPLSDKTDSLPKKRVCQQSNWTVVCWKPEAEICKGNSMNLTPSMTRC